MLPTATVHRYLVPTMLGASGQYIPAAVVVAAVVVVVAAEGAATAFRPGVAPVIATATVLFLAVLLGGPEEPEGLSAHRLAIIGGGVDLLFRRGVDSVRRRVLLVTALQLLRRFFLLLFSLFFRPPCFFHRLHSGKSGTNAGVGPNCSA